MPHHHHHPLQMKGCDNWLKISYHCCTRLNSGRVFISHVLHQWKDAFITHYTSTENVRIVTPFPRPPLSEFSWNFYLPLDGPSKTAELTDSKHTVNEAGLENSITTWSVFLLLRKNTKRIPPSLFSGYPEQCDRTD